MNIALERDARALIYRFGDAVYRQGLLYGLRGKRRRRKCTRTKRGED